MKSDPSIRRRHFQFKMLALAAGLILPAANGLAQSYWQGGASDYNNAASWNGAYNSGNPNCSDDSGSNNVVLIEPGDPTWFHGDTLAGNNGGTSGAYLQTGSTNDTGYPNNGNWLRMGIGSGSQGYYTLSNGVVNVAGRTQLGENGYGYLEVDGGVYNTGYNGNPGIVAGQGDFGPGSGTLVLNGGTINNINNETWFGEQGGSGSGTGYFFMNGGIFNANNWFVFGRNGGVGYGTMTGGTINFTGGGSFLIGGGGIGALAQSGGTINAYNAYLVPQSAGGGGGMGTNILSGSAVVNVYSWLCVGRGGYGEMDISGNASITHSDGGSHFDIGAGGGPATGAGVLNQNGGTVTEATSDFWLGEVYQATWNLNSGTANLLNLVMSVNGQVVSTMNLNGGLLKVNSISSPTPTTSVSTLNLNGGTLQANGNNIVFINNVFQAFLGGDVTIDSQGYNITIPQALQDNGGGSLTKIGTGVLALTGANSYAGTTTVSAGTLTTTTASSGGGPIVVANAASFETILASANGQLSAASLTVGGATGSSLNFDLGSYGTPTSAPLLVAGAFTANGTITINVAASALSIATIPLIQYGSVAGSHTFVLGALPPGVAATLATAGNTLELVVTSSGEPRWNGNVTGDWDLGSNQDWFDLITLVPTAYSNGKPVVFDDNATGTTTVNLTVAVSPGSINFNNNALPYTITGAGSINGNTGLNVNGANSVTLANTGGNTFTGPVLVGGGTLNITSLANGGTPSAIGASSANPTNLMMGGGTLSYSGPAVSINRGYTAENTNGTVDLDTVDSVALSGQVADFPGSGFVKSGPAQLTYATVGINALADTLGYSVAEGTVAFAGSGTNNIAGNLVVCGPNGNFYSAPLFTSATVDFTNSATVNIAGGLDIGDSGLGSVSCTGVVNQSGGSVYVSGQTFIGQTNNNAGASGTGIYNLSNGTLNVYNWLAVGRAGGVGTLNLSGTGVLYDWGGGGGNIDIGTSGGIGGVAGTGTLNQTGGAITNTASEVWLGEGSSGEPTSGTWNMSGGTAVVGEVHVGVGGTGTSTLNVSGSASITESYLLLANYDGNTTGNVNIGSASQPGGTVTVNADMNVAGQGTGTLNFVTNGGGKLTVTGTLYLSRFSQAANGTVNLNAGGTLVAAYINNGWGFQNNFSSPLDNPNAFNFNGGTLRAYVGSSYFIQPYVNAVIQSGGAIIDDNGFFIEVLAPLVNGGGGGGLTKLGTGTLRLDGLNTYTGSTVVSAGTLMLGPGGVIAGPVTVNSGATLAGDTGTIEAYNLNSTLTLSAGSTTTMTITPSSSDEISGLTSVQYGGALVVTNNSSSPLTVGQQYTLFHAASAGSGNFSSVTILPAGSGTFNPATGQLTITSTGSATGFSGATLSGGNLILTGTFGAPSAGYTLLTSTNISAPVSAWVTNSQGTLNASGGISNAIPVNTSELRRFFRLRMP